MRSTGREIIRLVFKGVASELAALDSLGGVSIIGCGKSLSQCPYSARWMIASTSSAGSGLISTSAMVSAGTNAMKHHFDVDTTDVS